MSSELGEGFVVYGFKPACRHDAVRHDIFPGTGKGDISIRKNIDQDENRGGKPDNPVQPADLESYWVLASTLHFWLLEIIWVGLFLTPLPLVEYGQKCPCCDDGKEIIQAPIVELEHRPEQKLVCHQSEAYSDQNPVSVPAPS